MWELFLQILTVTVTDQQIFKNSQKAVKWELRCYVCVLAVCGCGCVWAWLCVSMAVWERGSVWAWLCECVVVCERGCVWEWLCEGVCGRGCVWAWLCVSVAVWGSGCVWVWLCVCVWLCESVAVCGCGCVAVCERDCVWAWLCVSVAVCGCGCVWAWLWETVVVFAWLCVSVGVWAWLCLWVCWCVWAWLCGRGCVLVCAHVWVCVCVCMCAHARTHTHTQICNIQTDMMQLAAAFHNCFVNSSKNVSSHTRRSTDQNKIWQVEYFSKTQGKIFCDSIQSCKIHNSYYCTKHISDPYKGLCDITTEINMFRSPLLICVWNVAFLTSHKISVIWTQFWIHTWSLKFHTLHSHYCTVIPRLTSDPANEFFDYRRFFRCFSDSANECFSGCAR